MTYFNLAEPIFRPKQKELDYQDRQGLLELSIKVKDNTLLSGFYTRIDQVFVLWGLIASVIFFTAQFTTIDWITQAIFWSIMTLIGTVIMGFLTYFWVQVERLQWVLYTWALLMLGGVILTDCAILYGWGQVLMNLCPMWLTLSAIGYICTGLGMRSRAFIVSGIFHLLGIAVLPYFLGWQFLATGLIMTLNLLIFAETQWDMRKPIAAYSLLTEEQAEFNKKQYLLRQQGSFNI